MTQCDWRMPPKVLWMERRSLVEKAPESFLTSCWNHKMKPGKLGKFIHPGEIWLKTVWKFVTWFEMILYYNGRQTYQAIFQMIFQSVTNSCCFLHKQSLFFLLMIRSANRQTLAQFCFWNCPKLTIASFSLRSIAVYKNLKYSDVNLRYIISTPKTYSNIFWKFIGIVN